MTFIRLQPPTSLNLGLHCHVSRMHYRKYIQMSRMNLSTNHFSKQPETASLHTDKYNALLLSLPAARRLPRPRGFQIRRTLPGSCATLSMISSRIVCSPARPSCKCRGSIRGSRMKSQYWISQLVSPCLAGTARMIVSWGGSPEAPSSGSRIQKQLFSKVSVCMSKMAFRACVTQLSVLYLGMYVSPRYHYNSLIENKTIMRRLRDLREQWWLCLCQVRRLGRLLIITQELQGHPAGGAG